MNWTKKPPILKLICIGRQSSCKITTDEAENVFGKFRAPKLQQKKSPSNSEIVDFDHKPFLTMYKALLCQDESSLILTTTGQEKCFGKRFQREMCCTVWKKM